MQRLRDLLVPRLSATQPEPVADNSDGHSSGSELAVIHPKSSQQPEPESGTEAEIKPVEISTDSGATIAEESAPEAVLYLDLMEPAKVAVGDVVVESGETEMDEITENEDEDVIL